MQLNYTLRSISIFMTCLFTGILLKNTSIKPINQPIMVPSPYSMNNHTYQVINICSIL